MNARCSASDAASVTECSSTTLRRTWFAQAAIHLALGAALSVVLLLLFIVDLAHPAVGFPWRTVRTRPLSLTL